MDAKNIIFLLSVTVLGLVSGCASDDNANADGEHIQASATLEVDFLTVKSEPLTDPVEVFGTIAAKQTSAIGTLVAGPLETMFVTVGDRVKKGQALFQIRQADYKRRVAEASAALRLTEAQAIQAQRQYDRVIALAPRGFVSKAQVEQVETDLAVARAQVSQSQSVLATAKQALRDTIARAPYNGVVTARLVDEGSYLNNSFSMGEQSAALQLQELEIVAAIVSAPQARVDDLKLNQKAKVYIDGFDEPFDSFVFIINDRVDPESRTVELRLPIRNPNYRISSGLGVRALIETPPESAIILPRSAVKGDSAAAYVFLFENGIARQRDVKVESIDFERVKVTRGVQSGEKIIQNPPSTLRDGQKVARKQRKPAR
ncbi:efflux RND transporter periplasmic adaptor subunit [Sphingorhabdus sp. SMR4y]|uniref:efflux RND transporter periplasmic adaptor subunit n=1 Tax=Sphingorhabdus sp. SMR4y TaxID=2584094 RepID=UPI000B5CC618|nr:efflux RND transporter periplasmic adaptor subunit [Sphingorhabdus sp. SMR4y]ASK89848.1 multidrug efflux pump subunit AcrA [Sphingorhabdus sp. SMR4y]